MIVNWFKVDIDDEDIERVTDALKRGNISGTAPEVGEFERELARITEAKYAVAVMNGTAALIVAFMALKRKLGQDLNISLPTWTYIATANAADLIGKITLIDCDLKTFNMRNEMLTSNVVAPVDIGGLPADYDLYKKYFVVADAAESLGATYKGRKVGTLADLTTLSFHATKIVTTGEGGAVLTNDKVLAEKIREIIDQGYGFGTRREYYHPAQGWNFRMSAMQAALGISQLKKLDKRIKHRNAVARLYQEELCDLVGYQEIPKNRTSSYFLFTVLVPLEHRDDLRTCLFKNGIETKVWRPVHLQPTYTHLHGRFKNAEYLWNCHLHLPIHNLLTDEEAMYVVDKMREFFK
jgi:perosamine synthetase